MKKIIFFFFIVLFFSCANALDYSGTVASATDTAVQNTTLTRMQVDLAQLNQKVTDMQAKMILSSDVDKIISIIQQKIDSVLIQAIVMQLISLFFFFIGLICAFLILKFKKLI